jgi:transposase-like protein
MPGSKPKMEEHKKRLELRVFFSCPSCKAVYYATQKRKPSAVIGRFTCKSCNTTVHRWWGTQYSFTDWMGPLD